MHFCIFLVGFACLFAISILFVCLPISWFKVSLLNVCAILFTVFFLYIFLFTIFNFIVTEGVHFEFCCCLVFIYVVIVVWLIQDAKKKYKKRTQPQQQKQQQQTDCLYISLQLVTIKWKLRKSDAHLFLLLLIVEFAIESLRTTIGARESERERTSRGAKATRVRFS